eukprot:scaffold100242_cov18-Tisochrysis_lutea.AAC.3
MVVGAFGGASSGSSRAFRNDSTPLESAKGLDTFDAFAAIVQPIVRAWALLLRIKGRRLATKTGHGAGSLAGWVGKLRSWPCVFAHHECDALALHQS